MSDFIVGTHALVYLGHKDDAFNSEELAENICTHPARVRKVLALLKKSGLVETREGLGGGYKITKPLREISLKEVQESLNKPFLSAGWHSGNEEDECLVCSGMATVTDEIYHELNGVITDKLSNIFLSDIESRLIEIHKVEGVKS